jgi:hypothetical protein
VLTPAERGRSGLRLVLSGPARRDRRSDRRAYSRRRRGEAVRAEAVGRHGRVGGARIGHWAVRLRAQRVVGRPAPWHRKVRGARLGGGRVALAVRIRGPTSVGSAGPARGRPPCSRINSVRVRTARGGGRAPGTCKIGSIGSIGFGTDRTGGGAGQPVARCEIEARARACVIRFGHVHGVSRVDAVGRGPAGWGAHRGQAVGPTLGRPVACTWRCGLVSPGVGVLGVLVCAAGVYLRRRAGGPAGFGGRGRAPPLPHVATHGTVRVVPIVAVITPRHRSTPPHPKR